MVKLYTRGGRTDTCVEFRIQLIHEFLASPHLNKVRLSLLVGDYATLIEPAMEPKKSLNC